MAAAASSPRPPARRSARLRQLRALLAAAVVAAAAGASARAQDQDAIRRLIDGLRSPDFATRRHAIERLSRLGPGARPTLMEALQDADPEVRFHVLFLLHQAAGDLERRLRVIVEDKATNSPTYPAALEAYQQVLDEATDDTTKLLVQLVRTKAEPTDFAERYVVVGLDLLRALTEQRAATSSLTSADADALAALLDVELRVGFYDLVPLFWALPNQLAEDALSAVVTSGSPAARGRAVRVLAEVATPASAPKALTRILPLLRDEHAIVRRSALQALDLLALANDHPLTPVVSLAADPDVDVAQEAVRIVGERHLALGQEVCARLALDASKPTALRREAIRTLGLLGAQEGAQVLVPLATRPGLERSLRVTAAWALGALKAPNARAVLEGMIADPDLVHEPTLYCGLARLGDEGVGALEALARTPHMMPRQADAIDRLRARTQLAVRALGGAPGERATAALLTIVDDAVVSRERESGFTRREVREALKALGDRRDPASGEALGRALRLPNGARDLETLLPLLAQTDLSGAPPELRSDVVADLIGAAEGGRSPDRRADAADALARSAPDVAQPLLRRLLAEQGRRSNPDLCQRFARSLARAGDRTAIAVWAMPVSRRAFDAASAAERPRYLSWIGIDQLYGGEFREAIRSFRIQLWCKPVDDTATYNVACGYSLLGDVERGLHYLRRSVQFGFKMARHMETDTDLEVLWGEVRFERLVRRLRLAQETNMPLPSTLPPAWQR